MRIYCHRGFFFFFTKQSADDIFEAADSDEGISRAIKSFSAGGTENEAMTTPLEHKPSTSDTIRKRKNYLGASTG